MHYRILLAACFLLCLARHAEAQGQPANAVDLVYLGESRPILLRFSMQVEDKSVQTLWHGYLKRWFDFLDKNSDGKLDARELQHAPRNQAMLQLMRQGSASFQPGGKQSVADFNKDTDTALDDFTRFYHQQGVGAVQVSGSPVGQYFSTVDDALFKVLDRDGDGKLSRQELQDAAQVLLKLDTNDDEYITAQEIAPGASAQHQPGSSKPGAAPEPLSGAFYTVHGDSDSNLASTLLTRYDRDKNGKLSRSESGLEAAAFDLLDADKSGELDAADLARWHVRPADLAFSVRLGKTSRIDVVSSADQALAKGVADGLVALNDARMQVLCANIERASIAGRINPLLGSFRQADTKKRGILELAELQKDRQLQPLVQIFPLVDRDGDGKMSEKELQAFLDLQSGATECFASIGISENGRNLFKLLDANNDGRLSLRELKMVWPRLAHLDRDKNGSLDGAELVLQYQLTIDRGGPSTVARLPGVRQPGDANSPRVAYGPGTPVWFKKMDRNGDGDVSEREFLGTREEFNRIDTDSDGLISAVEAEQYDKKVRVSEK